MSTKMQKRVLTSSEIESILSFIKPQKGIPEETAMSVVTANKKALRKQLVGKEIYPNMIPKLKQAIEEQYMQSKIQAGESVGVIGAQSIGEKQTQSTLNSVDWADKLLYIKNGDVIVEPFGKMVDRELENNPTKIKHIEENRTQYLELEDGDYLVPSCDQNGFVNWYKIEAVTKHLPVGKLVKVKTFSGRTVTATQAKSFLVWNRKEFVSTLGSEIKIGDRIPTTSSLCRHEKTIKDSLELKDFPSISLDTNFGNLMGLYLARGLCNGTVVTFRYKNEANVKQAVEFCNNNSMPYTKLKIRDYTYLNIDSKLLATIFTKECGAGLDKKLPSFVYNAPDIFIKSLINGYYLENGKIDKNNGIITFFGFCEEIMTGFSFLLSYYGIHGKFSDNSGVYYLTLSPDDVKLYIKSIPIDMFDLQILLTIFSKKNYVNKNKIYYPSDRNVYFDKVISVEHVSGTTDYVYDITVETTRNFQLWNGFNCRDTFHQAGKGDKTVTTGVPRVEELLNATKDPKTVNNIIYLKDKHSSIAEMRKTIGHNIVEMTFASITKSYKICINKKKEKWYDSFKIIYGDNFSQYEDCLSLKIDMDKLYEYKLDMQTIAKIVSEEYSDMVCVFSPDSIGQLDIFVDTSNIELPENRILFINNENAKDIYLEEVVQPILSNIIICGVQGIHDIYFTDDMEKFETLGSNFSTILGLPFVDFTRTISNNVWDIYETLGIEAARMFLIEEFLGLMEGINLCHIQILVEKMTHSGTIASISRYSMRNEESGPFGKASFEESMDNFVKAGLYGQVESTNGVSASIICGKRAQIGTGICDLKMDVEALKGSVRVLHNVKEHVNNNVSVKHLDKKMKKKAETLELKKAPKHVRHRQVI